MSILIIIGICFLLVSGFLDSENKTTFKKVLGDFLYGLGCVLCGFGLFYYIVKDSPIEIKTHNEEFPNKAEKSGNFYNFPDGKPCIFYYDEDSFFKIILMILQEQQILFYGDNLELVTFSCFLFTKIITPFEWSFPLIPTLPLDCEQFLSGPVPFIAGIISDKGDINYSLINKKDCNIIHLIRNKIKIINNINKDYKFKGVLKIFKKDIKELFKNEILSVNKNELSDEEIKEKCESFLDKFNNIFKKCFIEKFYELIFGVNKIKYKQNEFIDNLGKLNLDNSEEKFFLNFSESQMFVSRFLSI